MSSDDLGAFLIACIDEDEKRAQGHRNQAVFVGVAEIDLAAVPDGAMIVVPGLGGTTPAEVAAKRALLGLADSACHAADLYVYHGIRAILADIYSDRPGFPQEQVTEAKRLAGRTHNYRL